MKKAILFLFLGFAILTTTTFANRPKMIFDTDMGNDCDDALAIMMVYKIADMKLADIACVAISKDNIKGAVATDIFASHYGYADIPICMVSSANGVSKGDGWFLKELADERDAFGKFRYARTIDEKSALPESSKFMRKILAESEDNSVIYVSVGFLTNLANLLRSQGDEISPLSGAELVKKKVKFVSLMAAAFSPKDLANPKNSRKEFNVYTDIESSRYVFDNCPVDMIFSGWEVGDSMRYPRATALKYFGAGDNPVMRSFDVVCEVGRKQKKGEFNSPTYDPTSVLYAVEPELFGISQRGKVAILDKDGRTCFTPDKNGKHRYLITDTPEMRAKILSRLEFFTDLKRR